MYSLSVKSDWDYKTGNGIRLLPDFEPVTVTVSTAYDGQGRCDYDKMISDIEKPMAEAWKVSIDLRQQADVPDGIEEFLKEIMIEAQIWDQPDVLGDFSLDSPGLEATAKGPVLRLKVKDSGYGFGLDCALGQDGRPQPGAIVDALTGAYRHVFRLAGDRQVFSSAQRNNLLQTVPAWAEGLMQQAGVVIPKAEVDLQSASWEENYLRLWVNVQSDKVLKYALPVAVSKQGQPDFSIIDRVAAQIAQEWGRPLGLTKLDWLCAKMAEEIGSDAKEYVNWILEEEAKLCAGFWEALNQELEGHLKKADDLHQQAIKWRADFDAWAKNRGNLKLELNGELSAGAGVDLAAQVPELPGQLKSTFTKIWEGLCKLPGAVYRGIKPKTGEIAKGLEFGFRAAWVVFLEAKGMAVESAFKAWFWNRFDAIAQGYLGITLAKVVSGRKAEYASSAIMLEVGRIRTVSQIDEQATELVDTVNKLNKSISEIKEDVYFSDKRGEN